MDEVGNAHAEAEGGLGPWKQALTAFRQACADRLPAPAAIGVYLNGFPPAERADVLVDLVCEHIKAAWRCGKGVPLQSYIAHFGGEFPEFASRRDLPLEVVECEFYARHAWPDTADHPTIRDYCHRFPDRPEVAERLRSYYLDGERYVRIRQQGQGGLGVVWLAYDCHLERYVAIKEPSSEVAGDARIAKRLAREARLTAGLDHPAIVAVHELLDADGGTSRYVMRLVQGHTLREQIREHFQPQPFEKAASRRLRITRLLQACADVCEAVAFAHQRHVLHRDLKSSNIVLGRFGETVLLDWGLATRVRPAPPTALPRTAAAAGRPEADTAHAVGSIASQPIGTAVDGVVQRTENGTRRGSAAEKPSATENRTGDAGSIAGTLPYMSPEQALGAAALGSDIFGLGAILYEILTGCPPYQLRPDEPLQVMLQRVRSAQFQRPRQVCRAVPRPLEAVCLKAMALREEDRYPDALALANDLRRWLADEPVSVYPNRLHHRLARKFRRHTGTAIAATALAILLLLATSLAGYSAVRSERREAALQELQRIRASERQDGWSDRSWELISQAARIRGGDDLREPAAAALAGIDVRLVKRFDFEAYSVAFSPDGRRLLIGGHGESGTRLWDMQTDTLSRPLSLGPGPVGFAVDGSPWQVIAKSSRSYEIWNVHSGLAVCELEIPFEDTQLPERLQTLPVMALSVGGTLLAASSVLPDGSPTLAVWNVPDRRLLRQWPVQATAVAFAPDGDLVAAGSDGGGVQLWSIATGEAVVRLAIDMVAIESLAFGRDVREQAGSDTMPWLLAAGDAGGTVTIWDLNRRMPRSYCRGSHYQIHRVEFSSDGVTLASCGRGRVRLWDVASGRLLLDVAAGNTIHGLAFSPEGEQLVFTCVAAFSDPGRVVVLALENGRGIATLRGLPTTVSKVWFSPDGRLLAGLSHDWKVAVWNLPSRRLMYVIQVPEGFFSDSADLAFDAMGQRMAFSSGKRATLWDLATGVLTRTWELPPGLDDAVRFHPDGHLLLARCETQGMQEGPFSHARPDEHPRVCRIRDLLCPEPLRPLAEITEFNWYVYPIVAPVDGSVFVAEGDHQGPDGKRRTVRAFDGLSGRELWSTANASKADHNMLAIDPTGALLQIGRCDNTAWLANPATGKYIGEIHECRALSPGAVYGVERGAIYQLDKDPATRLLDLSGGDWSGCVQPQFSPDGQLFAWGSRTGEVFVCEIQAVLDRLAEVGLGRGFPRASQGCAASTVPLVVFVQSSAPACLEATRFLRLLMQSTHSRWCPGDLDKWPLSLRDAP